MYTNIEEVYHFLQTRSNFGIKPGLERMAQMLEKLNHPEKQLKVIHIAGTNGKGSTLTFLKAALIKNGYVVGSFSSPSLEAVNEQIQINDKKITDMELIKILNRLSPVIQEMDQSGDHPTEFEIIVVAAILHMEGEVDVAIFETGMGGREDSTNCIHPILTLITNVEKDHTAYLGESYAEIAAHKAGIIKREIPVVTGELKDEARWIVEKEATEKEAALYQLNKDFLFTKQPDRHGLEFEMNKWKLSILSLSMRGNHQLVNAAVALAGLCILKERKWEINLEQAGLAVQEATMPGRFEQISKTPLVIIDGAHNPAGMTAFIKTIKEYYPKKNKHLIFAAFKDKELDEMISQLEEFSTVTFTSFSHPRAAPAEELYQRAAFTNKRLEKEWDKALDRSLQEAAPEDVIFAAGSLHFISVVKKSLQKRK